MKNSKYCDFSSKSKLEPPRVFEEKQVQEINFYLGLEFRKNSHNFGIKSGSFNRTIVELRQVKTLQLCRGIHTFNRTIVECFFCER